MSYFSANQFMQYVNSPGNYSINRRTLRQAFLGGPYYSHDNSLLAPKEARAILREAHRRLALRDRDLSVSWGLAKWYRPWDIVPSLRNMRAPEGDFTVGIEVEMGFRSQEDAQFFAAPLLRMKHVTLDWEGGQHPIEATFPPFLYSKLSSRTQAIRYSKLLQENRERLVHHRGDMWVGTHVNVGLSGTLTNLQESRLRVVNGYLIELSPEDKYKYFGRSLPYRYGVSQGGQFVEWKMFNSVPDPDRLRGYIHTAVELTKLVADTPQTVDRDAVRGALETGVRKVYKDGVVPTQR